MVIIFLLLKEGEGKKGKVHSFPYPGHNPKREKKKKDERHLLLREKREGARGPLTSHPPGWEGVKRGRREKGEKESFPLHLLGREKKEEEKDKDPTLILSVQGGIGLVREGKKGKEEKRV